MRTRIAVAAGLVVYTTLLVLWLRLPGEEAVATGTPQPDEACCPCADAADGNTGQPGSAGGAESEGAAGNAEAAADPDPAGAAAPGESMGAIPVPSSAPIDDAMRARIDEAVEKARKWYVATPHESPHAAVLGDIIRRRHGLAGFDDMADIYLQEIKGRTDYHLLLRRLLSKEYSATAADLAALTRPSNQLTMPGLFCDKVRLPADYEKRLGTAIERGNYEATHAMLGLIWARENGCRVPNGKALMARAIEQSLALITLDAEVTDVEIEAAALVAVAGAGSRVPPAFLRQMLDAQHRSGGWRESSFSNERMHWHATWLAMLALLEQTRKPLDTFVPQ